jgi:TonB-linked SusC/RagA family outer membrane protein
MKKLFRIPNNFLLLVLMFGLFSTSYSLADKEYNYPNNDQLKINHHWENQQQIEISGTVTDAETGNTLPGVNIVVQGTTMGTTTDMDGIFSIEAPSDATLIFSFVGYQRQTINVEGRREIDVAMQPAVTRLEEVVAIGYGEQSRETMTSSVTRVEATEIQESADLNPVKSLQGRVAGLEIRNTNGMPGSGASIVLRGGTSPSQEGDAPLVLVDGVRRDLDDINTANIESIQVLKDAASTAIYGAQGSNGIILVETKQGGTPEGEIMVNYSTQVENQQRRYPFSSAEDFLRISRMAADAERDWNTKTRLTGGAYPYSTGTIQGGRPGDGFGYNKYTVEFLDVLVGAEGQDYVDNKLNNEGYQTMEDPVTGRTLIFKDNDYQDVLFDVGYSHNLNVGFRKGETQDYGLYTNLGYSDASGIVKGTEYSRLSYTLNAEYWVRDNLKVNGGLNFQHVNQIEPRSYWGTLNRSSRLPHTIKLYYDDGTPAIGDVGGSPRNILHENYYQDYETRRNKITMRLGGEWEFLDDLKFRVNGSVYFNEYKDDFFEKYNVFNQTRQMSSDQTMSRQYMVDAIFDYDRDFGKHSIKVLQGFNYTNDWFHGLYGDGSRAPTDYIPTLNASQTEYERVSSYISENLLLSNFGRVQYNFDHKYLFEASYRYDGSSKFATENKWGFFPSFSAGWNLHREEFWNVNPVSTLKVRSSWGQTGNNVLDIEDTQGQYSSGYNYGLRPGILNTNLANRELLWETTTTFDVGMDLGLFDDKITLVADFFNKVVSDRLVNIPLPKQIGFGSIRANFGSLRTRGIELELAATALEVSDFKWDISLNFTQENMVITELPENENEKNRINGGLIYDKDAGEYVMVGGLAEGERPGGIWAFHSLGVYPTDESAADAPRDTKVSGPWQNPPYPQEWQQQKVGGDMIWEDVDGNGIIDDRDLVFMGYKQPDKYGGMTNSFSWKNLSARVVMNYALGHVISNGFRARANGNSRNRVMTITDAIPEKGLMWWEQGDNAKYPRYSVASDWDNGKRNHQRYVQAYNDVGVDYGYYTDNSLYITDGDWLAFREVSLSYTIPKNRLQNIASVTLTGGVHNLGYITGYEGMSPEQYNGAEFGRYPNPTQYKFGVRVTF